VSVLAVEAFLKAVNPESLCQVARVIEGNTKGHKHGLPVKAAFVGDAAAKGKLLKGNSQLVRRYI
jgi:hypothetical protein